MGFRTSLALLAPVATAIAYALALPPIEIAAFGWIALAPLLAATTAGRVRRGAAPGMVAGIATAAAVTPWLPALVADSFLLPGWPSGVVALGAWILTGGIPFALFGAWHAWATEE